VGSSDFELPVAIHGLSDGVDMGLVVFTEL